MGLWELLLTAVGLSMDAFAVSVCKGLAMKRMRYGQAVVIGLWHLSGSNAADRLAAGDVLLPVH